ncbi:hypothetical protein L1887_02090 [Cichorium endivia]|nr:hypothetical protein L1887_02090 [Cichorium endivia]
MNCKNNVDSEHAVHLSSDEEATEESSDEEDDEFDLDLDKVGLSDEEDQEQLPEIDGLGDSEDEEQLESDGQFSDEILSSDQGTQVCSSDEEDDDFDLDEDDDSMVQETIFENSSNDYSAREGENTDINSHVGVKEKPRLSSDHDTREGENPRLPSDHDMREGENPEVKDASTRVGEITKVKDARDGPNMSEERDTEPEFNPYVGDRKDEPGKLNLSQNGPSNGLVSEFSSPIEVSHPIINPLEPINDTSQPEINHSTSEFNRSDAKSEGSTTEEEADESKENKELKDNVVNSNLQGVSDRLKILLDKNTPIKAKLAKLEGGEVMQIEDKKAIIKKKKKCVDVNSGTYLQRITRSQSRRKNEYNNGVVGNKGVASSSEISENSFITLGILQQMEEMGDFCGFLRRSG